MKLTLQNFLPVAAVAIISCLTVPISSLGATANVTVVNNAFIPATTNISVNDQVTWTCPAVRLLTTRLAAAVCGHRP